jgi:DNA polymerase elongation subunit (family B)
MEFYTSIDSKNDRLYICGYRDGKKFKEQVTYSPYLFLPTENKNTPYKTIFGEPVEREEFPTIQDARQFVGMRQKVKNSKTYGMTDYKFVYLYDKYPGVLDFDFNLLNVVSIDIENDSEGGFANLDTADKEITAITLSRKVDGRIQSICFGFFDYSLDSEDRIYIKCKDEVELLNKFLRIWRSKAWLPDIITGWNNKYYDIRYIVNRMKRILPEGEYHKLSPFNWVGEETVNQRDGKEFVGYNIFGVRIIDYYEAYKKYATGERESYKLDFIAEYELKERKTDYSQYGSLAKLYVQNKDLFYTYNIQDTELILRLEEKIHYIEQIVTMAYIAKVNYDNMLKTVKAWDVLIHNYLMDQGIVVPFYEEMSEEEKASMRSIMGGYVKEPQPGLYERVVSLDFTSLYPSIAMTFNISPDMLQGKTSKLFSIETLMGTMMPKYTDALEERNLALTANGCFFHREKEGFFPAIMKHFFAERKRYRVLEAQARKEYEEDKDNSTKRNVFLKYKNIQTAYKLLNNSGYGAMANVWFRWFDNRLAEAITSTGQLASKYVAEHLNIFLNKYYNTKDKDYIVYQDTDSAYVTFPTQYDDPQKLVDFTQAVVQPEVARICAEFCQKMHAFNNKLEMKLEKVCMQAFFIRKKRYALNISYDEGLIHEKPKLKVTGLETVRSSVPKVTRDAMKRIFEMIFEGKQDEIHLYIEEFRKRFYKMGFDEIGSPTSVNDIDAYSHEVNLYQKSCPMQVKGAIFYNRFLREKGLDISSELIYNHDKVKCCYLRPENPTKQSVISVKADYPKDWGLEQFIDYDHQWEKTFLKPIENVFGVVKFTSTKEADLNGLF